MNEMDRTRVLFVVDRLPAPPRSGITIPAYHHLSALRSVADISMLWVEAVSDGSRDATFDDNRKLVRQLWNVPPRPYSATWAVLRELTGGGPTWVTRNAPRADRMPPIGYDFDVVWYTTLGLAAQAQAIEAWLPEGRRRLRVAAVSDCYTAMLRANGRDWFGPRWTLTERAIRLASWSRSWYSAKWERRALQHIDIVLVQTPTDAHWMRSFRMVGPRTRLVICPNGVETELFQIPIDQKADAISFVAPFSVPEEARAARHLLTDIWPFIRERLPNAKLRIVGPDLPEALVRKLKHDARVTYATHHPEVRDLYSDAAVMLNFNIKRLGLINRVVEAMAAGVVVVGQSGSFNGIDGFTHGIHGLVAETVSEMRTQLLHILPCTTARIRMAHSARKLASANFRWEQRVPLLLDVLHETRRR